MEKLTVSAGADLINNSWLEIQENAARDMLASTSLREEGVEGVVATADGLVRRHLAIRLNAMLKAIQLPAGIANLVKTKTGEACRKSTDGRLCN